MTTNEVFQVRKIVADTVGRDYIKRHNGTINHYREGGKYIVEVTYDAKKWATNDVCLKIESEINRAVEIVSAYEIGILPGPGETPHTWKKTRGE